jgi:hypothetical protein
MDFHCEFNILMPSLRCDFRMANTSLLTIELVNVVTSDPVKSVKFLLYAFAIKCFPIELVPCSDKWERTSIYRVHIMPGLLVSRIPQCP